MIRVNLLKAERKDVDDRSTAAEDEGKKTKSAKDKSAKAAKKTPTGNLVLVLVLVLIGALAVLQSQSLSRERNLLSAAQDEAARLQPVVDKLDAIEWQKLYLEKKVELIRTLRAQQGVAVGILDAVAKDIPDWVWLTELVLNKTGVLIKGKALSNVLVSDFVRNLEQSGPFGAVGIVNTQQRNDGGNAFLEFTLNATLPPAPPAGTAEPAPNVPAQGAGTVGTAEPAPNVPAQGAGVVAPNAAPGGADGTAKPGAAKPPAAKPATPPGAQR